MNGRPTVSRKRRLLIIVLGVYGLLWAGTALFGLPSVDKTFDAEVAFGSFEIDKPEVPVRRIAFSTRLRDPGNFPPHVPNVPWRARSTAFAIAPFVVIDEVAWQTHLLAGYSGRRVIFWFFGFCSWAELKRYWVS